MEERRLLLVEFLNSDRFCQYRSEMFPFVRGYCEDRGIELRWVCFGFVPRDLPNSPLLMTLPESEADELCRIVEEFSPTHLLLNEWLDDPLDGRVRGAAGDAKVDVSSAISDLWPEIWYLSDLEGWLDLPVDRRLDPGTREKFLVDVAIPNYDCQLIGEQAQKVRPFVYVVAGAPCLYHAPIDRCPDFEGVDLDGALRQFGCTFCTGGDDARYFYTETPLMELVLRQITRAWETLPEGRRDGEFLLLGTLIFLRMRQFFDAVLTAEVPPSHFFFWCRIDELARRADVVDAALPRLDEAGHCINVWNIGVENFSEPENRRFNKGISLADVEEAHGNITHWERDYPDNFRFSAHGGFGYILFTPWTTIPDLRVNLEKAEHYAVDKGNLFFYSRLQLFDRLPITRLAEKDGLMADEFDAPEFAHIGKYVAIVALEQVELPWRFQDPQMAAIFGVFIRLDEPWERGLFDDDEGFARVQTLIRRRLPEEQRNVYRFLNAVLDVAAENPEARTHLELISALEARFADVLLPEEEKRPDTPPEPAPDPPEVRLRRRLEVRVRELMRLLETNPKRLLRGFAASEVSGRDTGAGWGEIHVTLRRGDETLGVRLLPAAATPHAFKKTPNFAVMHDESTPVESDELRRLLDLVARATERYAGRFARGVAP